ncbi:MAG: hypothetical protein MUF45_16250 [Spirosomaceae bacterium]|jgi:hypothetical protein|nr:hypothetical protein [Spirosomataceae bacterium]
MLKFDINGYLTPSDVIELPLNQFEHFFVYNDRRLAIFNEFQKLLDELTVVKIIKIWIDGSFVTKTQIPNDIDVVFFIETSNYILNRDFFVDLKKRYSKVDSYFVENFPKEHPNYMYSETDELYWYHQFRNNRKSKVKKGFIQIIL